MALADHCVVINGGRIEDEGPAERVYARPATRFSATFMGESTLLEGRVVGAAPGIAVETRLGRFDMPGSASAGAMVWLALRPEHLRLGPAEDGIALGEVTVTDVVFQGSFKRVTASSRQDQAIAFIAKVPANVAIRPGDIAAASCRAEDIILLEH